MSGIQVKICGLSRPEDVTAAATAGASYIGFVFFEKSPRHVSIAQASALARTLPSPPTRVALTVNADDALLDAITSAVPLDMLQLHGSESPQRVRQIKARYGLPVIKAIGIASPADLATAHSYASIADQLLLDAKPPQDAPLPGGNGLAFDWQLIADQRWPIPWMLAGGLDPQNVAEAVRLTGATQLDVSSGVESRPGVKDHTLIAAFINAAKGETP